MSCGETRTDLTGEGCVDLGDLLLWMENWLEKEHDE